MSTASATRRSVGDVAGDGNDDVFRTDLAAADLFWGPLPVDVPTIPIDLRMGDPHPGVGEPTDFQSAAPADLDGDGRVDLVVTSGVQDPTDGSIPQCVLHSGWVRGELKLDKESTLLLEGLDGGYVGREIATLDANGDGFDDLAVGSGWGHYAADGDPVAWVFFGGP